MRATASLVTAGTHANPATGAARSWFCAWPWGKIHRFDFFHQVRNTALAPFQKMTLYNSKK
jgi:hypothetical protein